MILLIDAVGEEGGIYVLIVRQLLQLPLLIITAIEIATILFSWLRSILMLLYGEHYSYHLSFGFDIFTVSIGYSTHESMPYIELFFSFYVITLNTH